MKEQKSQVGSALATKGQIEQYLNSEKFAQDVMRVLPKHITPDRMIQVTVNALRKNPKLRECSPASFFAALMKLSQAGLEPDGYHAHLIPFGKEVQLIIDYKGLVTVIRRNPAIAVVKGNVVREHDSFIYQEGSARIFNHVPAFKENDPIVGAYSFVKFAQIDDWELDYQPVWKIEKVRQRSRAKDSGPWVTDYEEMCIKTVLRHHTKTLPLRSEERAAIQADDDQFDTYAISGHGQALPTRPAEFKTDPPSLDQSSTPETDPVVDSGKSTNPSKAHDIIEKLHSIMVRDQVKDSDVITVLLEHGRDVGDADNTGRTGDLPEDTIQAAIKHWPSVVFAIEKNRAKAASSQ